MDVYAWDERQNIIQFDELLQMHQISFFVSR
jgi:hypothetical protein